MSNLSDLDALINDHDDDGDLVRNLRSALRAKAASEKAANEELNKLRGESRSRTLADVLKDKGISDKAAKLFPKDTEPTAEAVDEWLGEFGELFGIEQKPAANATQEQIAAARTISGASAQAPAANASDLDGLMARMAAAKSQTELDQIIAESGLAGS